MGNDGGSIPKRRELVKNAARAPNNTELKATILESQTHAWTFCPLSNRLLATPIVSDYTGTLYNKDAVLEYLLPDLAPEPIAKHDVASVASNIKSLKDVVEVKFQIESDRTTKEDKRVCPITSKELGPSTKAVYLVPCGHAYSEIAIKEVGDDICVTCNEPYTSENVISILPQLKKEVELLDARIAHLKERGLTHSLKKASGSKKKKQKHATDAAIIEGSADLSTEVATERPKKRAAESQTDLSGKSSSNSVPAPKSATATVPGGIKNAATASLTARVLEEQEERNKRRKLGLNDNLKSLFSNTGSIGQGNGTDFMTRGFSIPKRA